MERIDTLVIGAGVIGLAIGRALSRQRELCVLEQESRHGSHTSSRNSGVIHAGIYHPADFLKTRLCIAGRRLLYDYCEQHTIDHRRCGKLLVASSDDELDTLRRRQQLAAANGVQLQWLDQGAIGEYEPALTARAALRSADSGIVDSDGLMRQLLADIEHQGSHVTCRQQVTAVQRYQDGFVVTINNNDEIACRQLVNAAGLGAHTLARQLAPQHTPPLFYSKGQYFCYHGAAPFRHLVYPLPPADGNGLGIHATPDIAGTLRFGPDARYVATPDYTSSEQNKAAFVDAIRRYFPALDENRLQADYCGIRPRLHAAGEPARDFCIQWPADHGVAGLVQLFGMESPGLTASLAIGEYVADRMGR